MNRTKIFVILFFLALWGFYVRGAAPSVTVGDAGEFITGAATLSLPHSPSFPLFVLAGKIFQTIVPWGNLAYRTNLLSAFLSVLAAALLFFLVRLWDGSPGAGLFAALCLAATPAFYHHGVVTEVFALNTCLFFALAVALAYFQGGLMLAGLLGGLGFANHQTLVLTFPGLAAAPLAEFLTSMRALPSRFRPWIVAALFFAVGLSLYLFLMARSPQNPPLDWGNPESWPALVHSFLRKDYGTLALSLGDKPAARSATWLAQWNRFAAGYLREVSWAGAAMILVGGVVLWKRKRAAAAGIFLAWFFSGPFFAFLGNMPFDAQSTGVLERFLILPVAASIGLAGIFGDAARRKWAPAAAILFFLPVFWLARSARLFPERQDFLVLDYARNLNRTIPPGAAFFMDGGDDTFYATAHEQFVEKKREDVALFDRGGLIFKNAYGPDFRRLTRADKDVRRANVEKSWTERGPLLYSTMNDKILPGVDLAQRGFLYQTSATVGKNPADLWNFYARRYDFAPDPADYRRRALIPFFPFMRARAFWSAKDYDGALKWADIARQSGGDVPWLIDNLLIFYQVGAYEVMQQKNWELAGRMYEAALRINPRHVESLSNLGVVAEKQGDHEKALRYYEAALAIAPDNVNALFNRAVIYWSQGRWDDVVSSLRRVLALNPSHSEAQRYLAVAEARRAGKQ